MTTPVKNSIFGKVDVHRETNNTEHRTNEFSEDQLIVRRGQPFTVTLNLTRPFTTNLHPLTITAETGIQPAEDQGTKSCCRIPEDKETSVSAKAAWKVKLEKSSALERGSLTLIICPSADAPIGRFKLTAKIQDEETLLACPVVLFNPWCPEDSVFLSDEEHRKEYVLNEQGIIFTGSEFYIHPLQWDFGQFEDNMMEICMKILDLSHQHLEDPATDVSFRSDPVYVGRVLSAMINSEDDNGVLVGSWEGNFAGGFPPTHWSGSNSILQRWFKNNFQPVKYGQCWVFAGVMCSVMRLLGIPCRVVTNFQSGHDEHCNLTIDIYHPDFDVESKENDDSIWNFHVWVEAWMRRPDLQKEDKYDGWQVLDPTPQQESDGLYCCGPASVRSILTGNIDLQYDTPYVFAEVNADCVDWLVKSNGLKVHLFSHTARVGCSISTKAIGSNERSDITDTYKHTEGSEKERTVFRYALSRDIHKEKGDVEEGEDAGSLETNYEVSPPQLFLQFKEVSAPVYGKDVERKLILHSDCSISRFLSINIHVQGRKYNTSPKTNVLKRVEELTLEPGKELSIPIHIPVKSYYKLMKEFDSLQISAIVSDKEEPDHIFLAEENVVLQDPPLEVSVLGPLTLHNEVYGQVVFANPVQETLKDCTLTVSGSGLIREDLEVRLKDMSPNIRITVQFLFTPHKAGEKVLAADFSCSLLKNVKGSCTVKVLP